MASKSLGLTLNVNNEELPDEEFDVADLRSGMSVVSTTTSQFESPAGATPEGLRTSRKHKPDDLVPPQSSGLQAKSVNASPSSPNLSLPKMPHSALPVMLSRSNTLPRSPKFNEHRSRKRNSEVDGLAVEAAILTKFRRWLLAIAIVDFDIDVGPVINGVYPGLYLYPSEAENIAFSAFPDSPQFDQGTQSHSFRVRQEAGSLPTQKRPATGDGFIYCFSHFTQKRDADSKRGYHQRAVVLLTHLQYPSLFTSLVGILGPLFEEHGSPMLESACHNIATWSDPAPGSSLELGFLGTVVNVDFPLTEDTQQLVVSPKYNPKTHILAGTAPLAPPPLLLFEASLSHLWSIWECVVLCEPILVFGASPAQTSQAVWWFRDLLRPIPLAADIRPFFTIHDPDHSQLVNKLPPKTGLILGVTNPFFERPCAHWPHVLSLGRRVRASPKTPLGMGPAVQAGPAPGWKTKTHKRFISKDRVLLKRLEEACVSGKYAEQLECSLALRQHFSARTNELLLPLSRYLNTLIPSPAEVSTRNLRLKPFNTAHFFASLKAHGSTLPFRSTGKRTELYERWLRTPSFGVWLAKQERIVEDVLRERMEKEREKG